MMATRKLVTIASTVALLAGPAVAQTQQDKQQSQQQQQQQKQSQQQQKSGQTQAQKDSQQRNAGGQKGQQRQDQKQAALSGKEDGEWISLTGKVKSVTEENFTLNYNGGEITVEMDDYDSYNDNVVLAGDRVTVTGRMDDNFYGKRTVEAESVYIDKLGRYYYADAADEESGYYFGYTAIPGIAQTAKDEEWVSMVGTVISTEDDELTLDTGPSSIKVDVGDLSYDPLDPTGVQRIDIGDRVSVVGEMDDADLFEKREILASSVAFCRTTASTDTWRRSLPALRLRLSVTS